MFREVVYLETKIKALQQLPEFSMIWLLPATISFSLYTKYIVVLPYTFVSLFSGHLPYWNAYPKIAEVFHSMCHYISSTKFRTWYYANIQKYRSTRQWPLQFNCAHGYTIETNITSDRMEEFCQLLHLRTFLIYLSQNWEKCDKSE